MSTIEIDELVTPEEVAGVSLPRAIATRFWYESERSHNRYQELTGQPLTQTPLPVIEGRIAVTAVSIEQVLADPGTAAAALKQVVVFLGNERLSEDLEEDLAQDPAIGELIDASRYAERLAEGFTDLIAPQLGNSFDQSLKTLKTARAIAQENGLSPAVMYLDNQLYEEVVRRTYTPTEFAARAFRFDQSFTAEAIKQVLRNALQDSLRLPEDMDEIEKALVKVRVALLFATESTDQKISLLQLKWSQPQYALMVEEIIRFWGREGLASLPAEIRSKLLDDRPPLEAEEA